MASFPHTLQKIAEAKHFLWLMQLAETTEGESLPPDLVGKQAFQFAFSAFLSAARAVPYLLQEEGANIPGFTRWYVSAREHRLNDSLMNFFASHAQYRLVFPDEVAELRAPPTQLTNHSLLPAEAREHSAAVDLSPPEARVTFEGQPSYSALELCGRHLQHLARLVDFAEAQLGPAPVRI